MREYLNFRINMYAWVFKFSGKNSDFGIYHMRLIVGGLERVKCDLTWQVVYVSEVEGGQYTY